MTFREKKKITWMTGEPWEGRQPHRRWKGKEARKKRSREEEKEGKEVMRGGRTQKLALTRRGIREKNDEERDG